MVKKSVDFNETLFNYQALEEDIGCDVGHDRDEDELHRILSFLLVHCRLAWLHSLPARSTDRLYNFAESKLSSPCT
jgi:hypothetical protein